MTTEPRRCAGDHLTCTKKRCTCPCHAKPSEPDVDTDPIPTAQLQITLLNTTRLLDATRKRLPALTAIVDNAARTLDATKTRLHEAVTRAGRDTDDGYKPASTGPVVTSTGDPDLFNRAFKKIGKGDRARWIPKTDEIRDTYHDLIRNLEQAERCATNAYTATRSLQALTAEEAQKILDAIDIATCVNCSRIVANAGNDWLRRGRCPACNQHLERNGVERPKELWERDL